MAAADDPFTPSDATVIRPRPGAGKRGSPELPGGLRPAPAASSYGEPSLTSTSDLVLSGLNPLVQAASGLLLLTGRLRGSVSMPDVPGLKRHTLDEIRRFEAAARAANIANEVIMAARYALCTALDEAILSTPWGGQSEWTQQPLLVALHRENYGGEKFFLMLERFSEDPTRHIDLMELQYLCIAFGFAGKYQVADRGHSRLAEVQHDLYRRIRQFRGVAPTDLSLRWRGREDRRNRIIRYVPWWVAGAAALAIVALTFILSYTRLSSAADPVYASLTRIGRDSFPAPAAPSSGPTLKRLLADDEAKGSVRVEEDGGRTRVTLLAADLFGSGSATPNSAYEPLLGRIAAALNRVPGRVLVEGHTDDQPLHSLSFRNNFELSRERAVGVVKLIQRTIDNPARVEWTGVGSSEPRYKPESTPENRARNRRVEIIHVAGA